jgi:hypothetical protein
MKTNSIIICRTGALAALIIAVGLSGAQAGTLENLERERAMAVKTMLDPEMQPDERHSKLNIFKRRLVDLERMVLRDKKLRGRNTPNVRKAFENYDLTFMAHSAAEKNTGVMDNWLEQLGLTTQSIMSANVRRR